MSGHNFVNWISYRGLLEDEVLLFYYFFVVDFSLFHYSCSKPRYTSRPTTKWWNNKINVSGLSYWNIAWYTANVEDTLVAKRVQTWQTRGIPAGSTSFNIVLGYIPSVILHINLSLGNLFEAKLSFFCLFWRRWWSWGFTSSNDKTSLIPSLSYKMKIFAPYITMFH